MNVHFIAIGGSAMHNLAIALHKRGYQVSGSDDEVFDPARKRLAQHGLLPAHTGWFPEKIHGGLDAVILGMHARADNPELRKARELKLPIYSYPEFLYQQSKEKTRIVIGGSHGKTTITAIVLHAMKHHQIPADYMVGAQLDGFDVMVHLSDNNPYMVIEGDEYLSSPIDPRPKFHIYKPHIALISGIAWDHINVFPTFEMYLDQFRRFIHCIEENGKLIYCSDDSLVKAICEEEATGSICLYPYTHPDYFRQQGKTLIEYEGKTYPVGIFGKHNMLNVGGAMQVCMQMGLSAEMFFESLATFTGASKRLELVYNNHDILVYRDFAHAPSKIRASIQAIKEHYKEKKLIVCMELHTYSSLHEHFLAHYKGSLDAADQAVVFYDPHAVKLKQLPGLNKEAITAAFCKEALNVYTSPEEIMQHLSNLIENETLFLFMSSGNFGGFSFVQFISQIDDRF